MSHDVTIKVHSEDEWVGNAASGSVHKTHISPFGGCWFSKVISISWYPIFIIRVCQVCRLWRDLSWKSQHSLDLSGLAHQFQDVHLLTWASQCSQLHTLDLSNCGHLGLEILALALSKITSLQVLKLGRWNQPNLLQIVKESAPWVKSLVLRNCLGIRDDSLENAPPGLRELDLESCTKITDKGKCSEWL